MLSATNVLQLYDNNTGMIFTLCHANTIYSIECVENIRTFTNAETDSNYRYHNALIETSCNNQVCFHFVDL